MITPELFISILGVSLGSFVGACAYRIPRGISVVSPRSLCEQCNATLRWYEIIPVLSSLISRGRCRHCGARISALSAFIEPTAAILLVLTFIQYGASLQFLSWSTLVLMLLLIGIIDWQHLLIPNKVIVTGIFIGAILLLFRLNWYDLSDALIGMTGAAFVLSSVRLLGNRLLQKESMGIGDIKLAALMGLFTGFGGFLVCVWLASLFGATYGLGRRNPGARLPFGSFLAASGIIFSLFQPQIHDWALAWLTSTP